MPQLDNTKWPSQLPCSQEIYEANVTGLLQRNPPFFYSPKVVVFRALHNNSSAHRYLSHCLFATEYVPYDVNKQSQLSSLPIAYYVKSVVLAILYMHYTTKSDSLMELK